MESHAGIGLGASDLWCDPEGTVHPMASHEMPGLVHNSNRHVKSQLFSLRNALFDTFEGVP
jgi:hypothetical protein